MTCLRPPCMDCCILDHQQWANRLLREHLWHFSLGCGFPDTCCMPEAPAASALRNSSGVCISLAPGGKLSILQEPGPVFKDGRVRNHRKDENKSLGNNWGNKMLLQFSGPQSVKSNISFSQTYHDILTISETKRGNKENMLSFARL